MTATPTLLDRLPGRIAFRVDAAWHAGHSFAACEPRRDNFDGGARNGYDEAALNARERLRENEETRTR